MSYNNELYIFSEVPGYDSSKGERLVPHCNVNMNMNNLGSTDIASEVVVSDTREVEIADILVGMPVETVVSTSCDDQQLISLQPLLDGSNQGIILQPQEEVVGPDSESEGLSAYEQIPVSTSDVIYDSSSHGNKRGRKGKRSGGKGKMTDEQVSENKRAARKWDRKQVQIKTLEGIVKAFRKLRKKVEYLEQVRITEKITSQNTQANVTPEITMADVQSEFLLTQICYITNILKEFGSNEETTAEVNRDSSEQATENIAPLNDNFQYEPSIIEDNKKKKQEKSLQTGQDIFEASSASKCDQKVKDSTDSHGKLPSRLVKSNSHPHYHLKLDDVPFILGASSTASHSVVANVQNIIAMMKSHNRALCAPKVQLRSRSVSSSDAHKESDANEMFREISEDLATLTQKQKKLAEMFDNPPTSKYEKTKPGMSQKKGNSCKTNVKPQSSGTSTSKNQCTLLDQGKKQSKNKPTAPGESSHKPTAPTINLHSNNNPQLARRTMLRSLKDFKRHLSQEDISWE